MSNQASPTSTAPVIPVMDLMIGQIVLAQSGNRDEYRPVHTRLSQSSQPIDVAKAIFNQTGCDCLYLADIDSFAGANPNWAVYNELLDHGFGLWVDADWMSGDRSRQIADKITNQDRLKIIVSSETLSATDQFEKFQTLAESGIELIFSLDKKGDSVITKPGELSDCHALELVHLAYDRGVRHFIVLDLESVGTMKGFVNSETDSGSSDETITVTSLLQEIKQELTDVRLISGGGVRDPADVQTLLNAGCQHVLVASAIHDCRLTPDDVSNFKV